MRRKHQKRVLINLLAIAVLALFLWVYHEYPLPTQEMEFHRTERQVLMEESQVVWVYEGQTFSDPDILVGVSPAGSTPTESPHYLVPMKLSGPEQ